MSDVTPRAASEPTAARFAELPERIDPSDYVETIDATPAPDPEGGRDPNTEWMLKHA